MEIPPSPLAIEPEAPAFLILQPPIIARLAPFGAPPFAGNPRRPVGAADAPAPAAPEEFLRRRVVWRSRLHRLGPRQETQRALAVRPARQRRFTRRGSKCPQALQRAFGQ